MIVEYKGYILQQSDYNHHYMIFKADTKEGCSHVSYTKPLTEEEAKGCIDLYLKLIGTPEIFEEDDET